MRVCLILILLIVMFGTTIQMPQNGGITEPAVLITTDNNNNVFIKVVEGCVTARNLDGACVTRSQCNFGPGVIDFTLYSPHWYKRQCKIDEACCPFKFLIEEKKQTDNAGNYEFDDDD